MRIWTCPGRLTFTEATSKALVGRTLLDETAITTAVQMRLAFRPQAAAPASDAALDDRPDLFTAIEEQTGLKLEGRRAPVDVLVVDAIERPTEN